VRDNEMPPLGDDRGRFRQQGEKRFETGQFGVCLRRREPQSIDGDGRVAMTQNS
jgi:hypothetical protein